MQEHAPHPATHDGKLLRRDRELKKGRVEFCEEVRGGAVRSGQIPLERFGDLSAGESPDAEGRHLANSGAELVAEGGPRNAGVRVRVRVHFPAVELSGKGRRDRRSGSRIEAVPQPADKCNALFSCQ